MPNPKQIEKEKIELTREFPGENLEKLEMVKQVREKLKKYLEKIELAWEIARKKLETLKNWHRKAS